MSKPASSRLRRRVRFSARKERAANSRGPSFSLLSQLYPHPLTTLATSVAGDAALAQAYSAGAAAPQISNNSCADSIVSRDRRIPTTTTVVCCFSLVTVLRRYVKGLLFADTKIN
jgi:hypothetical protein